MCKHNGDQAPDNYRDGSNSSLPPRASIGFRLKAETRTNMQVLPCGENVGLQHAGLNLEAGIWGWAEIK